MATVRWSKNFWARVVISRLLIAMETQHYTWPNQLQMFSMLWKRRWRKWATKRGKRCWINQIVKVRLHCILPLNKTTQKLFVSLFKLELTLIRPLKMNMVLTHFTWLQREEVQRVLEQHITERIAFCKGSLSTIPRNNDYCQLSTLRTKRDTPH